MMKIKQHTAAVRRGLAVMAGVALGGWFAISPAQADGVPDQSGHHLLKPVPVAWFRELSTDRPDQTESPYTVDAGRFQIEVDALNGTFDHDTSAGADLQERSWTAGSINLKAGLLPNVDIQFVFDSWTETRLEDRVANTVTRASGTGDLQTRLKLNLWGNDGGTTALAIMPFIKWPLSESEVRNGETEGGLIIPFAADLGGGWGLGAMTEFDFVSDGAGGRDTEYFNTIAVGRDLVGDLGAYLEFAALVTPESGGNWQGQLGLGFTLALGDNTQLDWGCNFGVTDSAPDYNPFAGITVRF